MATVTELATGSVRRDASGWNVTRIFDVRDVGGSAVSRKYNAALALNQAGAGYGQAHPHIPGVRVSEIEAQHSEGDPGVFTVTATYRGDADGVTPGLEGSGIKGIEVSSSTVRVRSYRDISGELMIIQYTGEEVTHPGTGGGAFSPGINSSTSRFVSRGDPQEAEFDAPSAIMTVTKEMPFPSHVQSQNTATLVNDAPWSGLQAAQWLSLGIDCTLNSTGTFDWRYQFAVAPKLPDNDTWKFRAEMVFIVNAVRLSNTVGNGIEFFDVYRTTNFDQTFGFSVPFNG